MIGVAGCVDSRLVEFAEAPAEGRQRRVVHMLVPEPQYQMLVPRPLDLA